MEKESSGAKGATDKVLPPQLASKETSSHWHCPPQTEAAIVCNIKKNMFTDPKEELQPRHLVRFLNMGPPPCRVISSRRQVASAPLKHFTYDYTERAFTNSKGYTWTPMYLHYCKPLITEQFCDRNHFNLVDGDDRNKRPANYIASKDAKSKIVKNPRKIQVFPLLTSKTSATKAPFWTQGKLGPRANSSKPVSYSKFMESPFLRKRKSWVYSPILIVNPPKIN